MNFEALEQLHKQWKKLLVIGRSFTVKGRQCHLLGLAQTEEETLLYLLEPSGPPQPESRRVPKSTNRKSILARLEKEKEHSLVYSLSALQIGEKVLRVEGSTSGNLGNEHHVEASIQVFLDMLSAGWQVPEWLKTKNWSELNLMEARLKPIRRLPACSQDTPVALCFGPEPVGHRVKKSLTLTVGKPCGFRFTADNGQTAACYITEVELADPWEQAEERFNDPRFVQNFSPEQLEAAKSSFFSQLAKSFPRGTRCLSLEYECDQPLDLHFFTKEYLRAPVVPSSGSIAFFGKPSSPRGAHGLPLRRFVFEEAVSPDCTKIPAELLLYYEMIPEWRVTAL